MLPYVRRYSRCSNYREVRNETFSIIAYLDRVNGRESQFFCVNDSVYFLWQTSCDFCPITFLAFLVLAPLVDASFLERGYKNKSLYYKNFHFDTLQNSFVDRQVPMTSPSSKTLAFHRPNFANSSLKKKSIKINFFEIQFEAPK